jgi:hypothetical protein
LVERHICNVEVAGSNPARSTMKINNLYKFFDYFGIIVFAFLFIDSATSIWAGSNDWRTIIRLLIGIGGLLVDGFLVFIYKENKN